MIKFMFMVFVTLMMAIQTFAQVSVKGYYRKDGTYVQSHMRSSPDKIPYNNYSYPGNTNPYTAKTATGNPVTYLYNYYKHSSYSVDNYNYTPIVIGTRSYLTSNNGMPNGFYTEPLDSVSYENTYKLSEINKGHIGYVTRFIGGYTYIFDRNGKLKKTIKPRH